MNKNGVKFGEKHSIDDWDLLLVSKSIGDPDPKTLDVEIPGANGKLDFSEWTGEILYNNRTLVFNFDIYDNPSNWWALKSKITNYLHGKRLKIILDQDSEYYYYGRCKITDFSNETTVAHITIECDCDPYKYKVSKTIKEYTVTQGSSYTFTNGRMKVAPTLTLSAAMTLSFNGKSISLGNGTQKVLDIEFVEGDNIITVTTGSGTLKAEYQEGDL